MVHFRQYRGRIRNAQCDGTPTIRAKAIAITIASSACAETRGHDARLASKKAREVGGIFEPELVADRSRAEVGIQQQLARFDHDARAYHRRSTALRVRAA